MKVFPYSFSTFSTKIVSPASNGAVENPRIGVASVTVTIPVTLLVTIVDPIAIFVIGIPLVLFLVKTLELPIPKGVLTTSTDVIDCEDGLIFAFKDPLFTISFVSISWITNSGSLT